MAGAEISMEVVSDFAELIATMPDQVDVTSCCDLPPILTCGDQSIANAALSMLQVFDVFFDTSMNHTIPL